ncbi:hypothetical protein [Chlamydia sp. 2742-308]|uniref:Sperm tail-specific-like protein n=1 Tax=Candidatus Chlamydia sanziniae TaxID=1806891 RepID=A0A1A9HYK7_9CHLA|nr:sperm tail-specific-like protein [Candidatus Chlamydia sanziniae]
MNAKKLTAKMVKGKNSRKASRALSSDVHQKVELGSLFRGGSLVSVKKRYATRSQVSCPEPFETQIVQTPEGSSSEIQASMNAKKLTAKMVKGKNSRKASRALSSDVHQKAKLRKIFREDSLVSVKKRYATRSQVSCPEPFETQIVQTPEGSSSEIQASMNAKKLTAKMVKSENFEDVSKDKNTISGALNNIEISQSSEKVELQELAKGAALPVLVVRPSPTQELAKHKGQKTSARKSAREVLEAREPRIKTNKLLRDRQVTSTLRYDMEKAAAIRVKRNCSVCPQVREEKSSCKRREERSLSKEADVASQEESLDYVEEKVPSSQTPKNAHNTTERSNTNGFYRTASSTRNTNIASYLEAKQYRCDSEETDWPCSSCVAKRKTHTSISVCTMVVTVLAMIVGAVVISNASNGSPTPAPTPTPTPIPSGGSGSATTP